MTKILIGGIIKWADLALIQVMGLPTMARGVAAMMDALGKRGISVQIIVQCCDSSGCNNVALTVTRQDLEQSSRIVEAVVAKMGTTTVRSLPHVAMIAAYGPHFRDRPAIAGTMFSALAEAGLDILAITTSISTVACVIPAEELDRAVAILEDTFELPK